MLRSRGVEFDAIEYLKNPPGRAALERIVGALADPPEALVRKDKRFNELGLKEQEYVTRQAVVALLLEHPELMQRPVAMRTGRAVIARPPEKLIELLEK